MTSETDGSSVTGGTWTSTQQIKVKGKGRALAIAPLSN